MAATESEFHPTMATLLWRRDSLSPAQLRGIADWLDQECDHGLPPSIVGLSMNDHHVRIELQ